MVRVLLWPECLSLSVAICEDGLGTAKIIVVTLLVFEQQCSGSAVDGVVPRTLCVALTRTEVGTHVFVNSSFQLLVHSVHIVLDFFDHLLTNYIQLVQLQISVTKVCNLLLCYKVELQQDVGGKPVCGS